ENPQMPRFAVILPAAGSSTRFANGVKSKLVQDLRGIPVIARAVLPFVQRPDTHYIYLAVPYSGAPPARGSPLPTKSGEIWDALRSVPELAGKLGGQVNLVPGGRNRAESVRAALRVVPKDVEWVAIHDAARPLLSQDVIDRTFAAAVEHGAAAP